MSTLHRAIEVLRGQRVLVTGATGLVGTHLLAALANHGVSLRATVHRRQPAEPIPGVEYMRGDLRDADACARAVDGVGLVYHCAANSQGAAVITHSPLAHATPNIVMNAQLLEAAWRAGVDRFVWIGSSTGYPDTGERPVGEDELMQGEPHPSYFWVGWMKRYTEVLCRGYREHLSRPMATVVLRATNLYGPYDDFEPASSHVLPALIRKVVEGQDPLEVWGTGEDRRDLLYVGDFVEAMLRAAVAPPEGGALNVGSGRLVSVRQMLELIQQLEGTRARIELHPERPSTIPVRAVATQRARQELGWEPRTSLEHGLARTIAWYRHSRGLGPSPEPS